LQDPSPSQEEEVNLIGTRKKKKILPREKNLRSEGGVSIMLVPYVSSRPGAVHPETEKTSGITQKTREGKEGRQHQARGLGFMRRKGA